MMRELRAATVIFLLLTVVTGVAYPALVTLVAQVAFPAAASGSLVRIDGRLVGSRLIGQSFSSPEYFWGRPSATVPVPNNGALSSGSNQGPLDPALLAAVGKRVAALRAADPGQCAGRAGRPGHCVRQRSRSAHSPWQPPSTRSRGWRASAAGRRNECGSRYALQQKGAPWVCSASHASTCSS